MVYMSPGDRPVNETPAPQKALGKLPAKSSRKALLLADFIPADAPSPPKRSTFWKSRKDFPLRTFGNKSVGCCTVASQCVMAMRMERLETKRTPEIHDDETLRVYYALTGRLYGGGDTGAYETDALDNWRRADLTFRDTKGRPLTIEAYTRVNHLSVEEVKRAIHLSAAKGVKVCFSLPRIWARVEPPAVWDVPRDAQGQPTPLVGDAIAGSWGGHSLSDCYGYTEAGCYVTQQWYENGEATTDDQLVTWDAWLAYADECHSIVDSADLWRKRVPPEQLDVPALVDAVNAVSSVKIPT